MFSAPGRINAAQFKRDRERGLRDLERSNLRFLRDELHSLVQACKRARADRRAAIEKALAECESDRAKTRKPFDRKLATCQTPKTCAAARTGRRLATDGARARCAIHSADSRAPYDAKIERMMGQRTSIEEDIAFRRMAKQQSKPAAGSSAIERRSEDDQAIETDVAGIDPRLVPLWRKMRRQFKAGERISRFERFMLWVEENPSEVLATRAKGGAVNDADLNCQEAERAASKGNREAQRWAADNCDDGKAKKRRK